MTDPDEGPRPGPTDAVEATPEQARGSVRRTTSIVVRRDGAGFGRATAKLRGRDLHRHADGVDVLVGEVHLTAGIDDLTGDVLAIDGADAPDDPGSSLVGVNLRHGYGRALTAVLPELLARRALVASVLEDLNGAFLVSGYAPLRRGHLVLSPEQGALVASAQQDVCAGWANGGPMVELLRRTGRNSVPRGPDAPDLLTVAGRWHEVDPPTLDTVTRIRSLDVGRPDHPGPDGAPVVIRAHFRDTYAGDDGPMVMHEYLVHANLDADLDADLDTDLDTDEQVLDHVSVEARVLPWDSCPSAVASADRLNGTAVRDIATQVRTELVGPSTCTHLNSTLRSLADVAPLLELLMRWGGRPEPRR